MVLLESNLVLSEAHGEAQNSLISGFFYVSKWKIPHRIVVKGS